MTRELTFGNILQALDFVANNALPAARSLRPEHQGLRGLPDTTLSLSVLEGEEAFLRTLHPGMGDPMRQVAVFKRQLTAELTMENKCIADF